MSQSPSWHICVDIWWMLLVSLSLSFPHKSPVLSLHPSLSISLYLALSFSVSSAPYWNMAEVVLTMPEHRNARNRDWVSLNGLAPLTPQGSPTCEGSEPWQHSETPRAPNLSKILSDDCFRGSSQLFKTLGGNYRFSILGQVLDKFQPRKHSSWHILGNFWAFLNSVWGQESSAHRTIASSASDEETRGNLSWPLWLNIQPSCMGCHLLRNISGRSCLWWQWHAMTYWKPLCGSSDHP